MNTYRILGALLVLLLVWSCNPTRRLSDGDSLLLKQRISILNDSKTFDVDEDDIASVLRQRPNRKVLFMRFHLGMYNLVNPSKKNKVYQRKKRKIEAKITKLESKGKMPGSKELRELRADTLGWRDWMTETVGEAPVVFDSSLTRRSMDQIGTVLAKNGYFNGEVDFAVKYSRSGKKVKRLTYFVNPGHPYKINALDYTIRDKGISNREEFFKVTSLVQPGDRFKVKSLDEERQRISDYLNNRGYYSFSKDFITFNADSTVGQRMVDVEMNIRRPQIPSQRTDSVVTADHTRYFIGKIFIHSDYDASDREYEATDTLHTEQMGDVYVLSRGELSIKPELLLFLLDFRPGDLYQKDKVDMTYRRMVQLPIVRSLSIQFVRDESSTQDVLTCTIFISQLKRKAIAFESGVTHRDGLFGLNGSMSFNHRNVFSGAELGSFRIIGGVEAQQPLTLVENSETAQVDDFTDNLRFNTFEIGPELTLNFNRFFPFAMSAFRRSNAPRTTLSAAFNYQDRPDYIRQLYQFRYSMTYTENADRGSRIFWDIWELSTIKIQKSAAFQNLLDRLNDVFLSTSYQDHLISSSRVGWVINTQRPQTQKRYFFNRVSLEAAGNLPRLGFTLAGAQRDEDDSYRIGGIQFAQYVKLENDFRYYRRLDEKNVTAFRIHAGAGLPGSNLSVLPFEKSFFAGGANGIRAWRPRTLGPGSYRDSTALVTFNNIGEIILEGSVEYRFELTQTLEAALFVDAGNIWLFKEEETRPGSGFAFDRFAGEIAFSAGFGLRFDFDFFLVRFDLAAQIKDPSKVPGERWAWQSKDKYSEFVEGIQLAPVGNFFPPINFNLGIGYPF